ncbi:unnamed protein product [Prunus armeniaca]
MIWAFTIPSIRFKAESVFFPSLGVSDSVGWVEDTTPASRSTRFPFLGLSLCSDLPILNLNWYFTFLLESYWKSVGCANLTAWCFGPRGCVLTRDVLLLDAVRLCAGVLAWSTVRRDGDEVWVEDG